MDERVEARRLGNYLRQLCGPSAHTARKVPRAITLQNDRFWGGELVENSLFMIRRKTSRDLHAAMSDETHIASCSGRWVEAGGGRRESAERPCGMFRRKSHQAGTTGGNTTRSCRRRCGSNPFWPYPGRAISVSASFGRNRMKIGESRSDAVVCDVVAVPGAAGVVSDAGGAGRSAWSGWA